MTLMVLEMLRDSPTHFICQFHATTGICSRGIKPTNRSHIPDHLVPFSNLEYQLGTKPLRNSTFLELILDIMEGPNIITGGSIGTLSRANVSRRG